MAKAGKQQLSQGSDDLKVQKVSVGSLTLDPQNARLHGERNLEAIKNSLVRFGQVEPLVVRKGTGVVIGGNGRLEAMRSLGWSEAQVVEVDLDDAHARALGLALNKTAELAEWDEEELSQQLKWLSEYQLMDLDSEIDISLLEATGFDVREVESYISVQNEGKTDPDDVPEVPQNIHGVKRGQIWQLGNHRLMCGDSTSKDDVAKLMQGEKASVWLSDPPYGINHVDVSQEKGQSKGYKPIANDDLEDDAFKDFIFSVITTSLPHMKEGFAFYMWHAMKMQGYTAAAAAAAAGILFHRQIIWVKPQFVFGRGQYHWRHELCLMGWLKGNEPPFYGERNQDTIWSCGRENDKIHPTQKPIGLLEPSIKNHTKNGEIVYEPFGGSGSTLLACEKLSRQCRLMELDQHYCSVIIERWQQFTGNKAVLITPSHVFPNGDIQWSDGRLEAANPL